MPDLKPGYNLIWVLRVAGRVSFRHCEERSDEAIHSLLGEMDCFTEPVIGRRFAPTRWLAMTVVNEERTNV